MNMTVIEKLPDNLRTYVKPPDSVQDEQALEPWLRDMVRRGALNLHIPECFLETIANLESDLIAQKYRVFILPIEGKTASAEFFLQRSPV